MKIYICALALLSWSVTRAALCNPPAPTVAVASPDPALQSARRAIDQGNANWKRAWKTQDASLLAAQFAPDGASFGAGGKVTRGRAALQTRFARVFKVVGRTDAVVETAEVWLLDDMAYETGRYVYTFAPASPGVKPETDAGRYVTIWQRQQDGSWLIHVDMAVPKE